MLSRTQEIFSGNPQSDIGIKRVGDIADVQYGLTVNAKRRNAAQQGPYLRVANVQRFAIDLSEVKEIGVEEKDADGLLKRHDILVVEGHADINELGRAAIWDEQLPVCYHQNHLIRVRCRENAVARYVLEYINCPAGRAYFRQHGKSTSGLNTLNSRIVRNMPIPMPALTRQLAVAAELRDGRLALEAAKAREQQAVGLGKLAIEQALGVK